MIRTYKYRAFAPRCGRDAFAGAVEMKRGMWADLCAMQAELAPALSAAAKAKDKEALTRLRQERVARIKAIRQSWAARGLAWGDYNAVVFQFDGACRASAARGALPGVHDGALGEAVVRQIMDKCPPPALFGRNDARLTLLPPTEAEARRRPGSRRSRYRTVRLDFQVRTDRNPAGPATLSLDVVMHRPLPPGGRVAEVRVIRTMRPIVRKDGSAGESERWHVTFAIEAEARASTSAAIAGVMPTWAADGEGGADCLTVAYDDFGARRVSLGSDHIERWERSRELFAEAEAAADENERAAKLAQARIFRRRIEERRRNEQRAIAGDLARRYGVIAIPKIWLAGLGAKKWTAPAAFLLELRRAVENAGGSIIAIDVKRLPDGSPKKRAQALRRAAIEDIFSNSDDDIYEAAE